MIPFDISKLQPHVWSLFSRAYKNDRVASTYLLDGQSGFGHWATAVSLAALLNCEKPISKDLVLPCGECSNCRTTFNLNSQSLFVALPIGTHKNTDEMIDKMSEVLELKRSEPFAILPSAGTTIPIEMARRIKSSLSHKGTEGVRRVVLFYCLEKMRTASADALLKLIEEPPRDTVIILTAENGDMLLPTIVSRSQRIHIRRPQQDEAIKYIAGSTGLSEERAKLALRISDGNIGEALNLLDELENNEESRRVDSFLLFKSLLTDENSKTVSQAAELTSINDRTFVSDLLRYWQSFMRDCHYFSMTNDSENLINVDLSSEVEKLSGYFSNIETVHRMSNHIKNCLADLRLNVHIQASLVALVLSIKNELANAA